MALDIVFMGTPEFSVPVLDALCASGHRIVAVYSQPPRPAGRGMSEIKSPVQRRAEALGLPVLTPLNFKGDAERADFAALKADAAVVVAYGLLLPKAVIEATRLGCYNVHASKLPRWRGAAPIQRAIMAGAGLDTGPVYLGSDVPIPSAMTAGQLHDVLSKLGAELMVEALARLEAGQLEAVSQSSEGVTYATKIDKRETRIDFAKPAKDVANHIRGLSPYPGAWFEIDGAGKRERIKVLAALPVQGDGVAGTLLDGNLTIACAQGAIRVQQLQRAGKQPMAASDFLRGTRIAPGTRFV